MNGSSATPASGGPEDRLDSWKEIAAYLNRSLSTVQRWERDEGLPVHRHQHDIIGSVYAFKPELEAIDNRHFRAGRATLNPVYSSQARRAIDRQRRGYIATL